MRLGWLDYTSMSLLAGEGEQEAGGLVLTDIFNLVSWGVGLLGAVSVIWGIIQLANAVREGGGAGTAQGVGGIVAGLIIIGAAALFGSLSTDVPVPSAG
jgi:hypothetical protein